MKTIAQILTQNQHNHNAIAINAPGRSPLSYAALYSEVQKHSAFLTSLGLRRDSAVALVLPNGPEMAVAFLSTAVTVSAAPLNPAYRQAEFEDYFADLRIEAVILPAGEPTPARSAAQKLNLPLLEMVVNPGAPAGVFTWAQNPPGMLPHVLTANEEDIALLLHTSGTTSRPKIVPLTHRNLYTSARNIANSLQLTMQDRCLNVMPLFHIHGLVGCLLATLFAGGNISCTEGFNASQFFDWLHECRPNWYSAVPTMHQAILARTAENQTLIRENPLRFIRSSSASMPPVIMEQLEQVFQTIVIEAYGMTEAAHQMAANPMPPQPRKAGSVGQAVGLEISILSADGRISETPNLSGEIVIRGENVTHGYLRNPEANQTAFTQDGWFRTGDQGYLDEDKYLHINGRLKEIINRGGEKILPIEVDQVLLNHPGVAQAVTFSIPHPSLGEEIGAAVVRKDKTLTEFSLRLFARNHLADFKVPRKIIFLEEIPKGPTGKLQRIGLAEKLGLSLETNQTASINNLEPRTELEKIVADIWGSVLSLPVIGVNDDFLAIGGDSISGTRIANRISEEFDIPFSIVDFFEAPNIEKQAFLIEKILTNEIDAMSEEEASRYLDSLQTDEN